MAHGDSDLAIGLCLVQSTCIGLPDYCPKTGGDKPTFPDLSPFLQRRRGIRTDDIDDPSVRSKHVLHQFYLGGMKLRRDPCLQRLTFRYDPRGGVIPSIVAASVQSALCVGLGTGDSFMSSTPLEKLPRASGRFPFRH